ncbi:MAG: cytochrome C, partial [Desulfobacula sp.]|nr:cytochrome C [Desulfobacula sp.]
MLLIIGSAVMLCTSAWAGITGSAHDFSGATTWNSSGEICITCHTPHNADINEQPLWNHTVTAASYTLYTSGTLDSVAGQPAGTSKRCLSGHDGTGALDSYG